MLCDNCQRVEATVHLTGWRIADTEVSNEQAKVFFEFHFCEACARQRREGNHSVTKLGSSARYLRMKVAKVSPDTIEVKVLKDDRAGGEDRWFFLSSRFPSDYAVEGLEFEMAVTDEELKRLKGEDAQTGGLSEIAP
jgi:hypothetical protein